MKFKTTSKAIRQNYSQNYILSIGYCDLQFLLKYENPRAYTSGVYGWNYDLYDVEGVAICTGYRGMPTGKKFDYNLVEKYDDKARKIIETLKKDNETWDKCLSKKEKAVNKLLKQFLKEVYTK